MYGWENLWFVFWEGMSFDLRSGIESISFRPLVFPIVHLQPNRAIVQPDLIYYTICLFRSRCVARMAQQTALALNVPKDRT
jgi:hypothetical protein